MKAAKLLLAFLLLVGTIGVTLWCRTNSAISSKLKDHFCNYESDDNRQRNLTFQGWKDSEQQPDTWDASYALSILTYYNKILNKNVQPMTADPNNISTITEWWQAAAMVSWYLKSPLRYYCRRLEWYGNWAVCQDKRYAVKSPCLVYSFGIDFDFRFDDAIANLGCDVRSFDPSMGQTDHQHSPNVMFYATGIGSTNTNVYHPRIDNHYVKGIQIWRLRTLKAIMRELGHSKRVIDVLKMDIETFEWYILDNMMETDVLKYVRHLLVEYHLYCEKEMPQADYVHHFQVLTRLRQLGFREYWSVPHSEVVKPGLYNQQGEVLYINYHFSPHRLQEPNVTL